MNLPSPSPILIGSGFGSKISIPVSLIPVGFLLYKVSSAIVSGNEAETKKRIRRPLMASTIFGELLILKFPKQSFIDLAFDILSYKVIQHSTLVSYQDPQYFVYHEIVHLDR